MKTKFIQVVLLSILLSACGKPTIDGSSAQSVKASIQKIKQSVSKDDFSRFGKAYLYIMMRAASEGKNLAQIDPEKAIDNASTKVRKMLNGMTASDVIKLAEELKNKKTK